MMARNENNRVTHERTGQTLVIDAAMQEILAETQAGWLEASPVTRGHFHTQCRTKRKADGNRGTRGHRNPSKGTGNTVNLAEEEEEAEYVFAVGTERQEKIEVTVGGCKLNMIIDSGASTNIVDKQTWEWLKRNKMNCESVRADKKLYTYGSQTPLDVIGTFQCETAVGDNSVDAEFCVIRGKGESLLGRETDMSLGVLKMGVHFVAVNTGSKNIGEVLQVLQDLHPQVFKDIGKLKGRTVQLHIDPDEKPVAQPIRRTPFCLRSKVEEKIKKLVDLDIIELVQGPSPWVNPVVLMPKPGGDIRLCIDMRRDNEAIRRARHPIPTA